MIEINWFAKQMKLVEQIELKNEWYSEGDEIVKIGFDDRSLG